MADELIDPIIFGVVQRVGSRTLVAFERSGDEVPDAGKEINAHSRMETIGVGTANCQEADLCRMAERNEGDGTDLVAIGVKQKVTLRIADLTTPRAAAVKKRIERLEFVMIARDNPKETAKVDVLEHRGIAK